MCEQRRTVRTWQQTNFALNLDELTVTVDVFVTKVTNEATLTNHLQQARAPVVSVLMCFGVHLKLVELCGQQGDLDFGAVT